MMTMNKSIKIAGVLCIIGGCAGLIYLTFSPVLMCFGAVGLGIILVTCPLFEK